MRLLDSRSFNIVPLCLEVSPGSWFCFLAFSRLAQPNSRHPLRNEVVVSPHPALPMAAAQVWLTRKGGIAVAFLLLGGGSRGVSRSKIAGKS